MSRERKSIILQMRETVHGLSVLRFFSHLLDDRRQSILRVGQATTLNRSTTKSTGIYKGG